MTSRLVFFGNDAWSVPSLDRIVHASDLQVVCIVTNPPRPAGRGTELRSTRVASAAEKFGAPLLEVEGTRGTDVVARLRELSPDLFVVVAYGEILSADLLAIPTLGALNLHFSMLPRWRGASPVQHALLSGDLLTGVTVMLMDPGLDTGPVLAEAEMRVDPADDAGSLGGRLAAIGADLLLRSVRGWAAGRLTPEPQSGTPTYARKLTAADRVIDWNASATEVMNRIRAFAPDPGASTTWRGAMMKVLRAEPADDARGHPGELLANEAGVVLVGTGTGGLRLLEVAPAGRRRMPAPDWMRGARPLPWDRFG